MPVEAIQGLVLTAAHMAAFVPWESVRKALRVRFGTPPRERRVWRGVEMEWPHGRLPMTVRVRRNVLTVRTDQAVTPRQLERLVSSLASVPNLVDLRVRGVVARSRRVAAGARPAWMDTARRFE